MSNDEIAERIIRNEGVTFALACVAGDPHDLLSARNFLKEAIASALAECSRVQMNTGKEHQVLETNTNSDQPRRK